MELILFVAVMVFFVVKVASKSSAASQNVAKKNQVYRQQINTMPQQRPVQQMNYVQQQRPVQQMNYAPQQSPVQRPVQQPTNIVERAKKNNERFEKDDVLEQMQKEHNHSEKVLATEKVVHTKGCDLYDPTAEVESMLGSVEDLMVKGYDGKLNFQRDFLGEGLDMINSFMI